MANHNDLAALSKRLIQKDGRLVTLQVVEAITVDDTKPWKGSDVENVVKEYKAWAVFVPPFGRELGEFVNDSNLLKRTRRNVLIEPIENDIEEKIVRIKDTDGTIWNIETCQALKPGSVTVLYSASVSR